MLILHQFPGPWDIYSASPFCAKLEAFLRWQHIPYISATASRLRSAPKKKIPYIEYDDESGRKVTLGDSQFIIEHLTRIYQLQPEKGLSDEQKAQGRAIRYLCEESLYRAMGYFRWVDDEGFHIMADAFFKPSFLRPAMLWAVRRYAHKQLLMQGIARHSREEVAQVACSDLQALSYMLGDKPYFFGNGMTTTDLVVFSVVANFLSGPFTNSVAVYANQVNNLVAHAERVKNICFVLR